MTSHDAEPVDMRVIKALLSEANDVLFKQREQEVKSGETFNVFSILKMESREDATHSAFIAELLSPKGSHNMGTVFLEKFLKLVKCDKHLDVERAKVSTECYIGPVNHLERTGGRIDIFIEDSARNSISIENKIFATDQKHQIERYVNYNRKKNQVYYLTLFGSSPSSESAGDLKEKEHFKCISYSHHVLHWLSECQELADGLPILRESIRQYKILIKKLTHQLESRKMNEGLIDIIKTNYSSALSIANSIEAAELLAVEQMFKEIEKEIKKRLSEKHTTNWYIVYDEDLSANYSGMYLCHSDLDSQFYIKIEGQPKIHRKSLIVGLVLHDEKNPQAKLVELLRTDKGKEIASYYKQNTSWWPCYAPLDDCDFNVDDQRKKLFDESERRILVKQASDRVLELKEFIETNINRFV